MANCVTTPEPNACVGTDSRLDPNSASVEAMPGLFGMILHAL